MNIEQIGKSISMFSYHNDPATKAKYIARIKEHAAADRLIKGTGWEYGKGCAVGCTLEAYAHERYPIELGIPEWVAHLEDAIFEGLPHAEAMTWPMRFLEAIPVGMTEAQWEGVFYRVGACRMKYLADAQEKVIGDKWGVVGAIRGVLALFERREPVRIGASASLSASLSAAWAAARSAARSATWSAAWSAALSASYAAEAVTSAARSEAVKSASLSASLSAAWAAETVKSASLSASLSASYAAEAVTSAAQCILFSEVAREAKSAFYQLESEWLLSFIAAETQNTTSDQALSIEGIGTISGTA